MSTAGTVAIVAATAWLAALTLVVLLLVRQHGLVVARLQEFNSGFSPANDGPDVGSPVPDAVRAAFQHLDGAVHHLLLLSATCGPCRGLVSDLRGTELAAPVAALVPGRSDAADGLVELIPPEIAVIRDPEASVLAETLGIRSSPFGLRLQDGVVARKSYLNNASDLMRLMADEDEGELRLTMVNGGGKHDGD